MDWSDTIEQNLPAPRDDEPQNLRRDIADELADHLACAADRERGRGVDEPTARENVLRRFGNPRRVARRLWLEWMKERIMTQRINLAALAVVAVMSIAAASFSWYTLEKTRDVTATILAKLEGLAEEKAEAGVTTPSEWTQLEVRCVQTDKDGPPAEGIVVEVNGAAITRGEKVTLSGTTDSEGRVTFAPIRIGEYRLTATMPQPPPEYKHTRKFLLLPKSKTETTIVCPAEGPDEVDVRFDIDWPDENLPGDVIVVCDFQWQDAAIEIGGDEWVSTNARGGYGGGYGGGRGFRQARAAGNWGSQDPAPIFLMPDGKVIAAPLQPGKVPLYGKRDDWPLQEAVRWYSGRYVLRSLYLYKTFEKPEDPVQTYVREDQFSRTALEQEYAAQKGRKNTWTVTVPESLLERLADRAD